MTTSEHRPTGPPTTPQQGAPGPPGGPLAPDPIRGGSPQAAPRSRNTARGVRNALAAGLLIFVTVVLVLFVVFNTQTVNVSLVFGDVDAPLVLALVIAAVLGGLVVGLAVLALRGRGRRR